MGRRTRGGRVGSEFRQGHAQDLINWSLALDAHAFERHTVLHQKRSEIIYSKGQALTSRHDQLYQYLSVSLGYKIALTQRDSVVVTAFGQTLGEPNLRLMHFFVRNTIDHRGNAIEPGALLVVRFNDMPRRVLGIGGFEHVVARVRIIIPMPV